MPVTPAPSTGGWPQLTGQLRQRCGGDLPAAAVPVCHGAPFWVVWY